MNGDLEAALQRLGQAERRIGKWAASPTPLSVPLRERSERELEAAEAEAANARLEIRRLADGCGHPEAHCPTCDGSVEQCREFCRSAAE